MLVTTLSDLVFHVREISSGRPDLFSVSRDGRRETLSAADFLRGIHSLALALQSRGVESGDRVAICSANRPEWHIVDLACQLLGAPTVPLSSEWSRREVGFILRNCGSRWVFYDDGAKRDLLLGLEDSFTSPSELVAFDGAATARGGLSITRLMGEGAARMGDVPIERFRGLVGEQDPASLVYASGGGGDPRGALLSHRDLITELIDLESEFDLAPPDRALCLLPLALGFQRALDRLCLYRGVAIRYLGEIDALPAALRRERPALLTALSAVYDHSHRRVRSGMDGGGRLRRRLCQWAVAVGTRHAAARSVGFVGPALTLQHKLAEILVYRDVRRLFGGSLRFPIATGGAVTASADELFRAVGMPLIRRDELPAAEPAIVSSASEPQP